MNSDDDHCIISLEGKSLRLAMDLIDYHDRLYHLQFEVFRPQVSLRSYSSPSDRHPRPLLERNLYLD